MPTLVLTPFLDPTPVKCFAHPTSFRAKGLLGKNKIANLRQFLIIDPHFVRKGCSDTNIIAILPQFLCIDPHFVGKGYSRTNKITNFPQVFTINPHFVCYSSTSKIAIFAHRPSFRGGTSKIAIFLSFWRSKGFSGTSTIAILPQFLCIDPDFVWKG